MLEQTRKVGERGQVTIPKELRERYNITGDDEVTFVEIDGKIVIKPATDEDRLKEGYIKRAERSRSLAKRMGGTSSEAHQHLGEALEWDE